MKTQAESLEARLQPYGVAIFRVVLGAIFVAHGSQKLFVYGHAGTAGAFEQMGIPFPALSAALVIGAELVGGVALILGALTRLAALSLAVIMLVAMLTVHLPAFFPPEGIAYPLALFTGMVALTLIGPGAWAVDNALWRGGELATVARAMGKEPPVRAAAA